MTDRIARPAAILALALVSVVGTTPGMASVHHRATHHHARIQHRPAKHHAVQHRSAESSHHHATKADERQDTKPSGTTSVPAGGVKLFCPAHRKPLLIRKSTQGAGTTVTLVCR